mmetsp:Transcript_30053/g.41935  ORF Transcript_30053/g.41935 Transcript_30053/m.41935 type:complete len:152 (+) Transcript_30053:21-476(+)|eukprot:CAMPEP_0175092754 /NCGR_PEP_ID=MMETSP0086_2-20121207/2632_1 /TAXON_ID=136419 /ORGANISM="Unknown Unknown, Strain D1" /LENGTH=151 /DNA_ID=CAMNT_0016365639 /DNA_START=21 /DNA_END=476 /DNA_ORIENTATION=+
MSGVHPKPKKKSALADHIEKEKKSQELNVTQSQITHIMESIATEIDQLDHALKADQDGKKQYDDQLNALYRKREENQAILDENKSFADNFDVRIGPFEARYNALTGSVGGLYDSAKEKHAAGLKLLEEFFDYHPAYLRHSDNFTAVPFRPK